MAHSNVVDDVEVVGILELLNQEIALDNDENDLVAGDETVPDLVDIVDNVESDESEISNIVLTTDGELGNEHSGVDEDGHNQLNATLLRETTERTVTARMRTTFRRDRSEDREILRVGRLRQSRREILDSLRHYLNMLRLATHEIGNHLENLMFHLDH